MALSRDACRSLELFASGLYSTEVADRLGLDPSTVRHHLAEAMIALGATSKLEAIARALQLGLIALPSPGLRQSSVTAVCPHVP